MAGTAAHVPAEPSPARAPARKRNRPWINATVAPTTEQKIRAYAREHGVSVGQAIDRLVGQEAAA